MNNWRERIATFFRDPFGKKRIQNLRADLMGYKTLNEILKEEAEECTHLAQQRHLELNKVSMTCQMYKTQCLINAVIAKMLGAKKLSLSEQKDLYTRIAPEVDPNGVLLFQVAQEILGPFDEMHFPYEANSGYFEDDILGNKGAFTALLIQYEDKLGQPKINRWKIAQVAGGYEMCGDWTIDKTTPEYMEFEQKLYARVFRHFYAEPVPFISTDSEDK